MSVHSSLQGQGTESSFIALTSIKDTWGLKAVEKPKTTEQRSVTISIITNVTEGPVRLQGLFGRFCDLAALPDPPCRKCGQLYPLAKDHAIYLAWATFLVWARIIQPVFQMAQDGF
jgi:hypothetical protein